MKLTTFFRVAVLLLTTVVTVQAGAYERRHPLSDTVPWDGYPYGDGSISAPAGCSAQPDVSKTTGSDPHTIGQYLFQWMNTSCTIVSACQKMATVQDGACKNRAQEGWQTGYFACLGIKNIYQYRAGDDCPNPPLQSWQLKTGFGISKNCTVLGRGIVYNPRTQDCGCERDKVWVPEQNSCVDVKLVEETKRKIATCPAVGNPVSPLSGVKTERVDLGSRFGWPELTLAYNSTSKVPTNSAGIDHLQEYSRPSFGPLWFSGVHRLLYVANYNQFTWSARGDGSVASFDRENNTTIPKNYTNDRVQYNYGTSNYYDAKARSIEVHRANLDVQRLKYVGGRGLTYVSSDTSTPEAVAPHSYYPIRIQDEHGRTVDFKYVLPEGGLMDRDGLVTEMQFDGANGPKIQFQYDTARNLTSIHWPDGTSRQFLYERTDLPWALTGVVDERGIRLSTFGYDAQGRAISTERAGGTQRYSVAYATPPSIQITDELQSGYVLRKLVWTQPQGVVVTTPEGATSELGSVSIQGAPYVTQTSQPAGSGCGPSIKQQEHDSRGNVIQMADFTGARSCYAYESNRNVESSRVEGLGTETCASVLSTSSTLPAGSRRVSTQWHPNWDMATKVAEPRKITTKVYNGQPDPFNGGATASCAPSSAKMPNDTPIVVLCKQVEQATTDDNGAQGWSAALQPGVAARVWQYTYNEAGQMLTQTDPLNHTTTYAYYASTTADYNKGDLQSVTNALGHATQYAKYNRFGKPLEITDANGVVTLNSYDVMQRLLSTSVAGELTSYEYWPTGQLKKATTPDGATLNYEYDDAQRLTAVADGQGNRIEYTLDNSGNRTAETVKDPSGNLSRQVSRIFDALGRAQQATGRE